MREFKLLGICLSLFDGGAAGGDGTGAAASGGDSPSASGGSQASPAVAGRGKKSGDTQRVLYGKQPAPAVAGDQAGGSAAAQGGASGGTPPVAGEGKEGEVKPTSSTLDEKRRAYRELMEGEYKDIYTEDTQHIIDRRFRETRGLEDRLGKVQPVIDLLMQRYKIGDGDVSKLAKAVENDHVYLSQAAEEAGMTEDQFREFQRLQRENAALLQAQKQSQAQQRANQQLQKWYTEAEQVKGVYPSFDLGAEAKNPQFLAMLRTGVPVQHAYEVIHMEEIKAGVAALQAKATEKQVVDGIRAKGARPQEAGTSSQSAFVVKDDVSKLTRKDRAEIARRASMGETITF